MLDYQRLIDENAKLLYELDELDRTRRSVMAQLGLVEDLSRLRAALLLRWLLRLYARRVGEARVIKLVKEAL